MVADFHVCDFRNAVHCGGQQCTRRAQDVYSLGGRSKLLDRQI